VSEPIKRGIFKKDNGIWWAWATHIPERAYSLHTRDEQRARSLYERNFSEAGAIERAFDRMFPDGIAATSPTEAKDD
jgi:hypothetical protein